MSVRVAGCQNVTVICVEWAKDHFGCWIAVAYNDPHFTWFMREELLRYDTIGEFNVLHFDLDLCHFDLKIIFTIHWCKEQPGHKI